jgi:hypothetical protein
MSIESKSKRAAGFIEEEAGEMLHKPGMAHKGRALRNEGRIEDGVAPKLTEPGHGKKE